MENKTTTDKDKVANEVVEFLPDALELKNQRLPILVHLCVWFPLLLLTLAIAWSYWAEVDVVVQGNGTLVTNLPTIVMKPLERSVISEIKVRIGDMVKRDQVLITFDPAFNKAEAERLRNEMEALQAQLERLKAEFSGRKYIGGEGQFEKWQQAIFQQRAEYYEQRIRYYDEMSKQINASKHTRTETLNKQRERLQAIIELEKRYDVLYKKGSMAWKDLTEMQITRMEAEAGVDQLGNELLELTHRAETNVADKNSFIQEWRNNISEDMVTADRNLTATTKSYDKVKQLIEYVCLKAPCDAVVQEIAAFSPGSAVQEAEALITLIPTEGEIEVESEIRPQDIAKVQLGAPARIKLTAYPFQKHGTLEGVVRNISEDTLKHNGASGQPYSYYRVRLNIHGKLRGVKENFRLIPGMETQCEIKCNRRRVLTYVLYPLIKALDETAREP